MDFSEHMMVYDTLRKFLYLALYLFVSPLYYFPYIF